MGELIKRNKSQLIHVVDLILEAKLGDDPLHLSSEFGFFQASNLTRFHKETLRDTRFLRKRGSKIYKVIAKLLYSSFLCLFRQLLQISNFRCHKALLCLFYGIGFIFNLKQKTWCQNICRLVY